MTDAVPAHHGRKSFFVVDEGVYVDDDAEHEGAEGDAAASASAGARAGAGVAARAAEAEAATPPTFRFSRIGPRGRSLSRQNNERIARGMTRGGGGDSDVPAGYTYVGQFIDHDLTFDKTDVMLEEEVRFSDLLQGRSPSLDLDSLYGAGPEDEKSAKFYSDDRHLKIGRTVGLGRRLPPVDGFDLPRRGTGPTARAKRRALIPDPRNDENLAVAQTHAAFIRFHNHVVDKLPARIPPAQRFRNARRRVVKHYQWMIWHDYLPRICRQSVLDDVLVNGRKIFEVDADPTSVPTMPLEFAVAAYRMGHSMVRDVYDWNREFPDDFGSLDFLFQFSALSGDLGRSPRLPSNWVADFRRLYDFREAGRDDLAMGDRLNFAQRIDTRLARTLQFLSPRSVPEKPPETFRDPTFMLAFRNLTRASMVRLATGQQMVDLLRSNGVPVRPLTRNQILEGSNGAKLDRLTARERDALATRTPLWFYVLREAETGNGKLRGVGARIVAETFHRAIEGSQDSILRDAGWRPFLGPDDATFRMVDLLLVTARGRKKNLAPLGD